MRRFTPPFLAAVSAIAVVAAEAPRPRYGGTLRVELAAPLPAIDVPARASEPIERAAGDRIRALVFETLVTPGAGGQVRPALATAWESDSRSMRWRFTIRRNVRLHDDSLLTAADVAASLTRSSSHWRVTAEQDAIVLEADRPMPALLWELADARHAIGVARGSVAVGSGPFVAERADAPPAGQRATLRAHQGHWGGRPFVNAIRIEAGRRLSDQLSSLEQGRADIVSIGAHDARRVRQRGFEIAASMPIELLALVRQPNTARAVDHRVRRALSLAIDRRAMTDVLLPRVGEPATALLPQWLTGYAALFQPLHDRAAARSLLGGVPADRRRLTVRFSTADPLARTLAERIALDAREAGLTITLDPAEPPSLRPVDFRLVRIRLDATLPGRAAANVRPALAPPIRRLLPDDPDPDASLDAVHRFERSVVDEVVVVPLVHAPETYAVGPNVESWTGAVVAPPFALDLANVWLRRGAP